MTKNGRDAHRELNGFFFSADNTLTLYEFHQFGTRYVLTFLCLTSSQFLCFILQCGMYKTNVIQVANF